MAFGALVAFTGILLLAPQRFIPGLASLRIALVAAAVALAAHVFERTTRRQPILVLRPQVGIALGLLGWAVITTPLSYWPGGSAAVIADQYLKAILFFWLIGTLVASHARLHFFVWTLVLCSIPLAVTGLKNFHASVFLQQGNAGVHRITGYSGLTANPNDLALMLNLLIPITGVALLSARSVAARVIAAGAMMLSVAAVIVTFSRAGFLTLAVVLVVSLAFLARRRAVGAAAGLLVAALCVLPFLPVGYAERLSTIADISSDPTGSAQNRWTDFRVAARLVVENPITGVGPGQNILALNEHRGPTWRAVHNAYLEYAVDLGIPGLVLFLWLLVASFRSARQVAVRSARDPALRDLTLLAEGVQVALIAFAVGAFFHPIAYHFYFFCVAGLAVAVENAGRAELDHQQLASAPYDGPRAVSYQS